MIENALREIGLTSGEIKVYCALLELETTTTGNIIKRSHISASKVYDILERLAQKGMVLEVIKQKTKHFQATSPEHILDYLKEKQQAIDEQKKTIQRILPMLAAKRSQKSSEAELYKGLGGVKTMFYNILQQLRNGDEYFVIGAGWGLETSEAVRTMLDEYHKKRGEKGIHANLLFNFDMYQTAKKFNYKYYTIKPMPQEMNSNSQIMILPDRIYLILWKKEPLGFVIKDQELRESFKKYFDTLWNQQTRTLHGIQALKQLIEETLNYPETLFIGGGGYVAMRMPDFWKEYNQQRIKKKHVWKNLAREEFLHTTMIKEPFMHYKILQDAFITPNVVWIFGNIVANVLWIKEPIVFVIENKEIAKSYREYFNTLWKNTK